MPVQELIQDYRQAISHRNQLLPYTIKHIEVQNGQPDILFHWHPEMEVILVREGEARIHIDYDRFVSQPGDLILVRPNGLHSIHPIDQQPHITDSLIFHLDIIGAANLDQTSINYLKPLQNANYKFITRIQPQDPGYDDIRATFEEILQVDQDKANYYELALKSQLSHLIYQLYHYDYVREKTTDDTYRKSEKLRQIIEYIHRNFANPITIAELAKVINYSETHFMTFFKQQTGSSTMDFIIQHRLYKASQALKDTVKPILTIAEEVGFNNLSNFNRQFRKYYHQTPRQYRQANRVATIK